MKAIQLCKTFLWFLEKFDAVFQKKLLKIWIIFLSDFSLNINDLVAIREKKSYCGH